MTHLEHLRLGLSNARARLAEAKTESERRIREVWVAQAEREIEGELRFLGLPADDDVQMTDDELMAELMG